MKILVTGFAPFGNDIINPSFEIVKRLPSSVLGVEIIGLEVPTVFTRSSQLVNEIIEEKGITHVLHIGQAGGRAGLTPEKVAINFDHARIPDNDGQQPIGAPIQIDGAAAYFSTLPVHAITSGLRKSKIPADVSYSAGTYVCNHLMYQTLYYGEKNNKDIKSGFIHVPFLPEQVADKPHLPSMSLVEMTSGILSAIETIVHFANKEDEIEIGGKTH